MKKTVLIILSCVLLLFSCSRPEKADVLNVYKELEPKAMAVNNIIYGYGLPYEGEFDLENTRPPQYAPVKADSPYKSVADIEAAVLEVYTQAYYDDALKKVLFVGYDNEQLKTYPRYKDVDGVLMVDVTFEVYESIATAQNEVSGATVGKLKAKSAEILTKRTMTVKGKPLTSDKTTVLVLTEKGWRFDNIA